MAAAGAHRPQAVNGARLRRIPLDRDSIHQSSLFPRSRPAVVAPTGVHERSSSRRHARVTANRSSRQRARRIAQSRAYHDLRDTWGGSVRDNVPGRHMRV